MKFGDKKVNYLVEQNGTPRIRSPAVQLEGKIIKVLLFKKIWKMLYLEIIRNRRQSKFTSISFFIIYITH